MGLVHDRYQECGRSACDRGVSADAYGYVNQELFDPRGSTTTDPNAPAAARWRTIMSYDDQCEDANVPGSCDPPLLRFSNPNQRYPDPDTGDRMGVLLDEHNRNSTAVDGPANAARVLNETRDTVADFWRRPVQISFATASYAVTEGGSVPVTVSLNAMPGRPLDIPLTATSTDGVWSGDYDLPASLTFEANQTERTFTFTGHAGQSPREHRDGHPGLWHAVARRGYRSAVRPR